MYMCVNVCVIMYICCPLIVYKCFLILLQSVEGTKRCQFKFLCVGIMSVGRQGKDVNLFTGKFVKFDKGQGDIFVIPRSTVCNYLM